MYVATVPNRNSPPAILLRESYRESGKVKTRTLANLTHLDPRQIQALRLALAGSLPTAANSWPEAFRIVRSLPHGYVAAVLGSLRKLQLDSILDPVPRRRRELVIAMIVARLLEPASKLATALNSIRPWTGYCRAKPASNSDWRSAISQTAVWCFTI